MQDSAKLLSSSEGLLVFLFFAISIIGIAFLSNVKERRLDAFLVADRSNSTLKTAFSIAVSWIWAPAIFICSMQSYLYGLPGIFWFTVPNFLCFFLFIPVALKLRALMPNAYSFPNYIKTIKYPEGSSCHITYLIIFLGYQIGAVVINILAGAYLLNTITGINLYLLAFLFAITPLAYSLRAGFKTSILTDCIQMILVLGICFMIVPWVIYESGSIQIMSGLAGVSAEYGSIFNTKVAYSMGIPMTLGLMAGPLADQMFFQRALSVKNENIQKAFTLGALFFVIVPCLLAILGFIAASLVRSGNLSVGDEQFVGMLVVNHYLPQFCLYFFVIMCLAGLCSTLDSALCAISSLLTIDVYKTYIKKNANENDLVKFSRLAMILACILGLLIVATKPKLIWIFMIYGALASAAMPTSLFILFKDKFSSNIAVKSIVLGLVLGMPLSIYANYMQHDNLKVLAALVTPLSSLFVCLLDKIFINKPK